MERTNPSAPQSLTLQRPVLCTYIQAWPRWKLQGRKANDHDLPALPCPALQTPGWCLPDSRTTSSWPGLACPFNLPPMPPTPSIPNPNPTQPRGGREGRARVTLQRTDRPRLAGATALSCHQRNQAVCVIAKRVWVGAIVCRRRRFIHHHRVRGEMGWAWHVDIHSTWVCVPFVQMMSLFVWVLLHLCHTRLSTTDTRRTC